MIPVRRNEMRRPIPTKRPAAHGHFVTLVLAELDTQTGILRYASCGHPSSYVLNAAGELKGRLDSAALVVKVLGVPGSARSPGRAITATAPPPAR